MTAVADVPAQVVPFALIPRTAIDRSPLNPRKHFDHEKLQELAQSLREVGIIEPIVVRPREGAAYSNGAPGRVRFELIAGERRWRAAEIAGLDELPAIVRVLDDAQVLEIMVVENNQREGVSPLEEADGFKRILAAGLYGVEGLAKRIGRSKKYIHDRIKLLSLVPEAQDLLADGQLTAGHAILLARLTPEQQRRAIDPEEAAALETDYDEETDAERIVVNSVRDLQAWIARTIRFDVKAAAAASPDEFGELAKRVEDAEAQPGRGKKVIAITFSNYVTPGARDEDERTFGPSYFKLADGKEHPVDSWSEKVAMFPRCEHSILGLVVSGAQHYGEAFDVCIARDKCDVHWGAEIREKQKSKESSQAPAAKSATAQRKAEADRWEKQRQKEEAERKAWDDLYARAWPAFAAHVKSLKLTPALMRNLLDALASHVVSDVAKVAGPMTDQNLGQVAALAIVRRTGGWNRGVFLQAVKPFKFNLAAIEAEGREPKAESRKPATPNSKPAPKKGKAAPKAKAARTKSKKR